MYINVTHFSPYRLRNTTILKRSITYTTFISKYSGMYKYNVDQTPNLIKDVAIVYKPLYQNDRLCNTAILQGDKIPQIYVNAFWNGKITY